MTYETKNGLINILIPETTICNKMETHKATLKNYLKEFNKKHIESRDGKNKSIRDHASHEKQEILSCVESYIKVHPDLFTRLEEFEAEVTTEKIFHPIWFSKEINKFIEDL